MNSPRLFEKNFVSSHCKIYSWTGNDHRAGGCENRKSHHAGNNMCSHRSKQRKGGFLANLQHTTHTFNTQGVYKKHIQPHINGRDYCCSCNSAAGKVLCGRRTSPAMYAAAFQPLKENKTKISETDALRNTPSGRIPPVPE